MPWLVNHYVTLPPPLNQPHMIDICYFTYNSLNHLHSLSPHARNDLWYVHLVLFGGLAQSYVNGNQCPRPTNPSTTIEKKWTFYSNLIFKINKNTTYQ